MQQASAEVLHSKPAVNIGGGQIYICDEQCMFVFNSGVSGNITIKNQDDLLTVTGDNIKKNTIDFLSEDFCPDNSSFALHEILINGPSRHTLFGRRFDLELEFVYVSADAKEMVAVSVFGEVPEGTGTTPPPNKLLTFIANNCFPQNLKTATSDVSWSVDDLLPRKRTFFTYNRSAKVKNIVLESPITVPLAFVKAFKKYVVTAAAFKAAMDVKPAVPNGKLVVYATVSPPVDGGVTATTTKPTSAKAGGAGSGTQNGSKEGFENKEDADDAVIFVEHMENKQEKEDKKIDQGNKNLETLESQDAGFSALFALGWYILFIVLFVVVTSAFFGWETGYVNLYNGFVESPEYAALFVVPLVIVILLSIPIESSVGNGPGKTALYFFIYVGLTLLMIVAGRLYRWLFNEGLIEPSGNSLVKFPDHKWFDFCTDEENARRAAVEAARRAAEGVSEIGVAVPAGITSEIGIAVPAAAATGDVGVAVPAGTSEIGVAVPATPAFGPIDEY